MSKATAVKKKPAQPLTLQFIEPMKARLVASPPAGDWIYEIKFDGFRAMALKQGRQVRLLSRKEKDLGGEFPEIAEDLGRLGAKEAIIDGEIVALDAKGRSSFQLLQALALGQERPAIFFYAFDLLHLNRKDLRDKPLVERKSLLEKLLRAIRTRFAFPPHWAVTPNRCSNRRGNWVWKA